MKEFLFWVMMVVFFWLGFDIMDFVGIFVLIVFSVNIVGNGGILFLFVGMIVVCVYCVLFCGVFVVYGVILW